MGFFNNNNDEKNGLEKHITTLNDTPQSDDSAEHHNFASNLSVGSHDHREMKRYDSHHSKFRDHHHELRPLEEDIFSVTSGGANPDDVPGCHCPTKKDLTWGTEAHHIFPYEPHTYIEDKKQVFREFLSGFTVSFAQVGESIAFSYIANVPPTFGLHAAWIVGLITAFLGSRTAMINGATAVRAVVVAPFVKEEGIVFLFYVVILIALVQLVFAIFKLTRFVKLVPHTVMIGFKNGLSIILAHEQEFQFRYHTNDETDEQLFESDILTFFIIEILATMTFAYMVAKIPKIGKYLPPSLFGILGAMLVEYVFARAIFNVSTPTIGNLSSVGGGLPGFIWNDYGDMLTFPEWEQWKKLLNAAFIAAAAGSVECVMMMEVTNDLTDTSNKSPNQQLYSMSLANFVAGIMGTMGGGATIGTSVINCKNGANGRYRISAVVAALSVLFFVVAASTLIEAIPTSSLVGIMFMVVIDTFYWESLPIIFFAMLPKCVRSRSSHARHYKVHKYDAAVIVVVTVVTLISDLFIAVVVGVLMTSTAIAWNSGKNFRAGYTEIVPLESLHRDRHDSIDSGESSFTVLSKPFSVPESDVSVASAPASFSPKPRHQHHHYRQHKRNRLKSYHSDNSPSVSGHSHYADHFYDDREFSKDDKLVKIYHFEGPLFFATTSEFLKFFTPKRDPWHVQVRFHCDGVAVQDFSAFHALNKIGKKYQNLGKHFLVRDLDMMSQRVVLKADALRRYFDVEYGDEILQATPVTTKKRGYHVGKTFVKHESRLDVFADLNPDFIREDSEFESDNPQYDM